MLGVARGGQGAGRGKGTHRWTQPGLSPVSSEGAHWAPRTGNEGSTQNVPQPPRAAAWHFCFPLPLPVPRRAGAAAANAAAPQPPGAAGYSPCPGTWGTGDTAGPGSGSMAPSPLQQDLVGCCFVPVAQLKARQRVQRSESRTETNQGDRGTSQPTQPTQGQARGLGKAGGLCQAGASRGHAGTGQRGPRCCGEDPAFTTPPAKPGPRCPSSRRSPAAGGGIKSTVWGWHCEGSPCPPSPRPLPLRHCQSLAPILLSPRSTGCSAPKAPHPEDTAVPVESLPTTPKPTAPRHGALKPQPLQRRLRQSREQDPSGSTGSL